MLLLMGVLMALTPNIAQLRGEGRRAAVGPLVHRGFWMALFLGGLILLLIDQAPKLYVLGADPSHPMRNATSMGRAGGYLGSCFTS